MPKLIREGRMGAPKTHKTRFVVNTYPKPMLVFSGDDGGLDVCNITPEWVQTPNDLKGFATKPQAALPPLVAIDWVVKDRAPITDLLTPGDSDTKSFANFLAHASVLWHAGCPWKTVVIDPLTTLADKIISFACVNKAAVKEFNEDARKWAGTSGRKLQHIVIAFTGLPCHVVLIMHAKLKTETENKNTIEWWEPIMPGDFKNTIGRTLSQFFFAGVQGGKPYVRTVDLGIAISGLGSRWPYPLPELVSPPDFNTIYGEAVKRGELVP